MIEIKEYIKKSLEERRMHTRLLTPCCERGGNSTVHKGVLAQFLGTTIPSGRILLCHLCNNDKCSNPLHLYWGTDKENVADALLAGARKSPWQNTVAKHGVEKACHMNADRDHSIAGKGNTGTTKTELHRQRISEGLRGNQNRRV